jgi:hypothetical protein
LLNVDERSCHTKRFVLFACKIAWQSGPDHDIDPVSTTPIRDVGDVMLVRAFYREI